MATQGSRSDRPACQMQRTVPSSTHLWLCTGHSISLSLTGPTWKMGTVTVLISLNGREDGMRTHRELRLAQDQVHTEQRWASRFAWLQGSPVSCLEVASQSSPPCSSDYGDIQVQPLGPREVGSLQSSRSQKMISDPERGRTGLCKSGPRIKSLWIMFCCERLSEEGADPPAWGDRG